MNVLNKVCHTIFIIQFSCGLGLNNGARQMLLLTYLLLLTYNMVINDYQATSQH